MALHFDSGIRWLCFCIVITATEASLSGLYLDNGLDQTEIDRAMTHREKAMMEHEILDLLGLPTRPRRSKRMPLNSSAPIFLMDIYKSLAEEHDSVRPTRSSDVVLSGEDLQAIDESDVIMTFQSKNHHGASMRHEKNRRLWFDISEVPVGETIFNAELRIFKASNYSEYNPLDLFVITAHKITSVDHQGGLELEFVGAKNTTAAKEGWIEINITSAFIDWVAFPYTNNGLYISVHLHSKPEHEIHLEDIGIVSMKGEDQKQPFMVAFLKSSTTLNDRVSTRKKRQAGKHRKSYADPYGKNPLTNPVRWSSKSCQIHTMYVSFKDLNWHDWIIAPDGYPAFYCSGECNFPLNAHMNATNHAIVQTLVHLMKPTEVPKPCCAPTKLAAISVLYFLDESVNIIMKKYKNMVVKTCGCH